MDTLEAIDARCSVKAFDTDYRMPEGDLNKLLNAAMKSPTSFNIQYWRFIIVKNANLRRKIRAVGLSLRPARGPAAAAFLRS